MTSINEAVLEQVTLEWLAGLGYEILDPSHFDPEDVRAERTGHDQVILEGRLLAALERLNPSAPIQAVEEALRRISRHDAPTLIQNNQDFHRMLADGLTVEVAGEESGIRGVHIRLFDFQNPDENDWVVGQQIIVVDRATGSGQVRRADLVVFVNGLPLAVIELKNPASSNTDIWDAYRQLQTYKRDIPSLFVTNAVLVISDGVEARIGSLTASDSRFAPWRTVDGREDAPPTAQPLQVLVKGVFHKRRFLDLARSFVTFEVDHGRIVKKLAGYHQFHAVRRAVEATVRASGKDGDGRIGVVWHTQGSGKSLTMVFYAGKLVLEPAMQNPTLVVLTDRNDLDDQLFQTFSQSQALLRQEPARAGDRAHLRELLSRSASGGIYFTTMQKFLPEAGEKFPKLSDRRNIVVIADEAHRSQYGFKARVDTRSGEMVYGFAKHLRDALPHASFIGFTGTPVELTDKNTVQVFGNYLSVYDIRRAVDDHATVPIFYESRLAKLDLDERERPKIDPTFEELTEGEEIERQEALKSEWASIEALAGTEKRLRMVAADLVQHFEKRQCTLAGKALIVGMSRRICADLYAAITALRPDWHGEEDDEGKIKVVITGAADDEEPLRPHIRGAKRRERLADRFKDPTDPLQIVIVRDMWLTGFDAPCLHTLYVDKPMKGHNLMQAIARVNRVFGDKPGGLVVDYIGIAPFLKDAMLTYAQSGGKGDATEAQEKAVQRMMEKLEICRDLFHGFDYQRFFTGTPAERLALLPAAREHVLIMQTPALSDREKKGPRAKNEPDGYDRFLQTVTDLSALFALAMPHEKCDEVRNEVAFFQAVKAGLVKLRSGRRAPSEDLGHAVRQIVANAVVTDGVVDIFEAAGIAKPDISILSDEFLAEIRGLRHKNLAVELLLRLLADEMSVRKRKSVIQARSFAEMLEMAIQRYRNRSIDTVQVIDELIELAHAIRDADKKGEALGLSTEELAFYEALADNESARNVLGDPALKGIARELTELVRKNATVDWHLKRTVQARLRVLVKRVLRERGYPPDGQQKATETVLEQAKLLGINIAPGASESPAEPGSWAEPPRTEVPPSAAPALRPPEKPRLYPYPIAIFDSLVESQSSVALRVKTRIDGIEKALTFLVAAELSSLRAANGDELTDEVRAILGTDLGKPVSMGTWLDYAFRLAALLPADSPDPVHRAARALVTPTGKPSELTKELQTFVLPFRNEFTHGVTPSEEVLAPKEAPLHDVWKRLKQALSPLVELRLVSRAKLLDFAGKGSFRYALRVQQGPNEVWPLVEETIQGELVESWCYLLRNGEPPLRLSPFVLCSFQQESGRWEMFMARTLALEPGAKVDLIGVATTSKAKVQVPL